MGRNAGRNAQPTAPQAGLEWKRGASGDVGETESRQPREQHVAVQPATDDSDQERVQHRPGLIHETGSGRGGSDEVRDVLHDREAEADHRAIHESVHQAVELARDDEEQSDDARELERLLDRRAHDRGAPLIGHVGRSDLAQN